MSNGNEICWMRLKCFNRLTNRIHVHEWSEKFSASNLDGNNIGKVRPQVSTSVLSIHVKLQVILSSSLFYTAVCSRSVVCIP
jgi:hypothetical protein